MIDTNMRKTITRVRREVLSGELDESVLLARLIHEERMRIRYVVKIRGEITDLQNKGVKRSKAA